MEKLLSIDELSEILGVTKATIYSWTSRNKIPHMKLSKRVLKFNESEILDWISKKSVQPDSIATLQKSRKTKKSTDKSTPEDHIERIIEIAKEEVLHS